MKNILLLILLSVGSSPLYAQQRDNIPLHYYLQQNFDTTIILHSFSAWNINPNYRIVSIIDGSLCPFTYKNPVTLFKGSSMPKPLANKFISRMVAFGSALPDTNDYFLPYRFNGEKELPVKRSLDSLHLWEIQDDSITGEGCVDKRCEVYDSGNYTIWLITKNEIKKLKFYDPEFFEKCCPGRIGRQKAIKLIKIIGSAFH